LEVIEREGAHTNIFGRLAGFLRFFCFFFQRCLSTNNSLQSRDFEILDFFDFFPRAVLAECVKNSIETKEMNCG
jgi:hypothetical protein